MLCICHIHEVYVFIWLYKKESILLMQARLFAKHQRPVGRKYIKVTDLWPKNTPDHIPHNYRQIMAAEETVASYCGDCTHGNMFTLLLNLNAVPASPAATELYI